MANQSNLTDLAEANRLIDDLRASVENITSTRDDLQTKLSTSISENVKLVKDKAELWDMVSTGKKVATVATDKTDEKVIDLDEMDM